MKNDIVHRWKRLWQQMGCTRDMGPLFKKIIETYSEKHRVYHDFSHIQGCLEEFDNVRHKLEHPAEVEMAIWFHDIVYDPDSLSNEADSAAYAASEMKKAQVEEESIRMVKDLVLATRHDSAPSSPDAQYLMDIDIATLGATPEVYWRYENKIRKEYAWVPEPEYREKRRAILTFFLKKPGIYRTSYFRLKYAKIAEHNLEAALRALDRQRAKMKQL